MTESIKAEQSIALPPKQNPKRIIQQKQHKLTINMIIMSQKWPKQARISLNWLINGPILVLISDTSE